MNFRIFNKNFFQILILYLIDQAYCLFFLISKRERNVSRKCLRKVQQEVGFWKNRQILRQDSHRWIRHATFHFHLFEQTAFFHHSKCHFAIFSHWHRHCCAFFQLKLQWIWRSTTINKERQTPSPSWLLKKNEIKKKKFKFWNFESFCLFLK